MKPPGKCFAHTNTTSLLTSDMANSVVIKYAYYSWYIQSSWHGIMKRKIKQWWSTIPLISTKRTTTPHLNWTQKYHDIWSWKSRSWYGTDTILEGLNMLMGRQPSTFIYIYLESYHFTTETTSTRVVEVASKSIHSI